jgi:hypothetical protein
MSIKKIKEPSNKYTLFAFVKLIKNKLWSVLIFKIRIFNL